MWKVVRYDRVQIGFPKGSVIGPLLFRIYINDLEHTVGSDILKFADDTIFVIEKHDLNKIVQSYKRDFRLTEK